MRERATRKQKLAHCAPVTRIIPIVIHMQNRTTFWPKAKFPLTVSHPVPDAEACDQRLQNLPSPFDPLLKSALSDPLPNLTLLMEVSESSFKRLRCMTGCHGVDENTTYAGKLKIELKL